MLYKDLRAITCCSGGVPDAARKLVLLFLVFINMGNMILREIGAVKEKRTAFVHRRELVSHLASVRAVWQNRISQIYIKGDSIAMNYDASYKNSKNPSVLRKEPVSYALKYGNKKATQHFQTTVKTIKKMAKTMGGKKESGLKDLSKNLKKVRASSNRIDNLKLKASQKKR